MRPSRTGSRAPRANGRGAFVGETPSRASRGLPRVKPTPKELRALARRDPKLASWLPRLKPFPGFPDRKNARQRSHYAALAGAIVYQQLSTAAATTIWNRACALTPGDSFPEPAELLRLAPEALRGAGLSQAKVAALRDLATRIEARTLPLERLARWPDERVIEELVEVRGIGVWSAQMFLMFRLGRLDVFAPADLGLGEGLRMLDELDERPALRELEARAECWRPLRSVASWTLWRLVEHRRAELAARESAPRTSSRPPVKVERRAKDAVASTTAASSAARGARARRR